MGNIIDYIENCADKYPQKTAIALKDEKYTFSELRNISRCLASAIPPELNNSPICVLSAEVSTSLQCFLQQLTAVIFMYR